MRSTPSGQYIEDGYIILDMGLREEVATLRQEFLQVFDTISRLNGLGEIKNDQDIIEFYSSDHRDLWIGVYDQLRQLPGIYHLADRPVLESIQKVCGLGLCAYTSVISVRVDMPLGEGSMPTKAHQDYPTHQGSGNSVTLWIPLQDVTSEDGPVQAVAGSHLSGIIPTEQGEFNRAPASLPKYTGIRSHMESSSHLDDQMVEVPVTAGQVLVFSQLLLHRSGVNVGNRIRYSLNIRLNDLTAPDYTERKYYLNETTSVKTSHVDFTRHPDFDPKFPLDAD